MAKKVTNPKLLSSNNAPKEIKISKFNTYANKIVAAKKKKVEKMSDTKKRLMESKKTNKLLKVSKKSTKFALLDDNVAVGGGLTHKGKKIDQIKQFNDMQFGSQVYDDQFNEMHQNLNFTGFDEQENQRKNDHPDRPKSKTQIYKEIIEKSKHHKHLRQQQYEENFNTAVELDQKFAELVPSLKFRNRDSNVLEKINTKDNEFERLMNELKESERVVSNKIYQKNEKYTQKMRKKKNDQLNELMKEGSDEQGDIRGWIKDVAEEDDQSKEDELDDVELSSQGQEEEEEIEESEDEQKASDDDDESESESLGSEEEEEEEESLSPIPAPVINKKNNKKSKLQQLQSKKVHTNLPKYI